MIRTYVWDPLVRVFHWALVAGFAANAFLTDPEGALHEQLGYVVAGLVGFRILWGFIGPRHARFADFPPSPSAAIGQLGDIVAGRIRCHLGHTPLGALMIYNLLATLALIALTGWMMTTKAYWGVEWVEEAHEVLVTLAELSVLAHVAAVAFESVRTRVNLPKAMVTGYKEMPETEGAYAQEP
jgi:cytochrome b